LRGDANQLRRFFILAFNGVNQQFNGIDRNFIGRQPNVGNRRIQRIVDNVAAKADQGKIFSDFPSRLMQRPHAGNCQHIAGQHQRSQFGMRLQKTDHFILCNRRPLSAVIKAEKQVLVSRQAGVRKSLSQAAKIMTRLPQVLVNLKLTSNDKKSLWQTDPAITAAIAALDEKYAGRGRVLVRASGTEPLIRVMIEGEDERQIDADARELAALMEKQLL